MAPKPKSSNELAIDRTALADQRTLMAANRTLMAWVRTGLSLISFGFTIYKFLQAAQLEAQAEGASLAVMRDPRRAGLFLIGFGVASLILGCIEYFQTVKRSTGKVPVRKEMSFSFVVALVLGLFGLYLLISIATGAEIF